MTQVTELKPDEYEAIETNSLAHIRLVHAGQTLQHACHGLAYECGWWNDLKTGEDMRGKRNVGELLCLIHSEISEAMEAHRKSLMDDKLPHRSGLEVELADAVIRIFDLAGGYRLDLGAAIAEKLEYNASREDHKRENRAKEGGKAY
jgi:NTP pyrophosphatase (non-canonical NTP hydrolase)